VIDSAVPRGGGKIERKRDGEQRQTCADETKRPRTGIENNKTKIQCAAPCRSGDYEYVYGREPTKDGFMITIRHSTREELPSAHTEPPVPVPITKLTEYRPWSVHRPLRAWFAGWPHFYGAAKSKEDERDEKGDKKETAK
jgi:hypothetical protein